VQSYNFLHQLKSETMPDFRTSDIWQSDFIVFDRHTLWILCHHFRFVWSRDLPTLTSL
jgi:hypothetical protein